MSEMLFAVGILGVVITIVAWLIIINMQRRSSEQTRAEHQAWERAQEARLQQWKTQQERQFIDFKQELTTQIQQIQKQVQQTRDEWKTWEEKDAARSEELKQAYQALMTRERMEFELVRLPRVEDIPLPAKEASPNGNTSFPWQPANFQNARLSERDLSSRYLRHADLRDAQLTNAKLFMTDLSWANLAGADLSGADLSAANLAHADLRGAKLTRANLLVADLNHAVLIGTNLRQARNLSVEQLQSAIVDSTTQFDADLPLQTSAIQPKDDKDGSTNQSEPLDETTLSALSEVKGSDKSSLHS
ncbi:hypothetical protein EPA93_18615 [Ktedonosporobacter rubrisoli]|uniref:Pentapeptide repeat-containing protein n=1 Tax=Ktedonosporobacter rubrisoli TaxID=2509675 RepID=A0A4P6JR24_KTERU|nr:pentapeptide repeat-containing protein [Ktedonosporobacter rubrisoli]QBD77897.1 hypothetical protein EPA93_18615 [Ktedonosporobacter rubrisoli]